MGVTALILGGAPSVWSDLERAKALTAGLDTIIVATNDAGWLYEGRIDAWATLHPEKFADWRERRASKGLNTDYRAFAHRSADGVESYPHGTTGSSGLFAAEVAIRELGASGAILCGVPMEREAGHIVQSGEWKMAEKYKPAWLAAKEAGLPVRSMSGWTARLFGYPDGSCPSLEAEPMHVRFTQDHDYTPVRPPHTTTAYKAGWSGPVPTPCGLRAIELGRAVKVDAPSREKAEHVGPTPRAPHRKKKA